MSWVKAVPAGARPPDTDTTSPMEVVLIRSTHLQGDSRSSKMIADYEARGFNVTKLMWTRGIDRPIPPGTVAFQARGLVGGRFRNLFYFLRWHLFIVWYLIRNAGRAFTVHCVDFDTGLVAVPLARLTGKPVVYDAFDHFASSFRRPGPVSKLFLAAERFLIRSADVFILPDRSRMEQYGLTEAGIRKSPCVISNMPDATTLAALRSLRADGRTANAPIHLCYLGTLETKHRGLEFVPELCRAFPNDIRFTIGGNGVLEDFFTAQSRAVPNLDFIGFQPYDQALRIMAGADCLYGPYLLTARHHRYAAPNKMFEHLALGKPLITNDGTPPGRFIGENNTGFLFDGSYPDLKRLIGSLDRRSCSATGYVAATLWSEQYSTLRKKQVSAFFDRLDTILREAAPLQ